MIIYRKLGMLLKERGMVWKDLQKSGIAANTPFKFSTDKGLNTDSIDKVCAFLQVQPGDIMEWVADEKEAERLKVEQQIAELQEKLKKM